MRSVTLLFHDVVPEGRWELSGFAGADADIYKLECGELRRHLAAISGTPQTTAEQLLSRPRDDRPLLLTFDDGGVSASLYTADILDEFGWKAHFLITAGQIGAARFVNPAQIRDLRKRGHVIGSHSFSHPMRMAYCSAKELDHEWGDSVERLSDILGERVEVASVPCGYYSKRVGATAARAGIKLLFTSEPVTTSHNVDGCEIVGRFTVQRGTPPAWSQAIAQGHLNPRLRAYAFWNSKKAAKALLGTVWLKGRAALLSRRAPPAARPSAD